MAIMTKNQIFELMSNNKSLTSPIYINLEFCTIYKLTSHEAKRFKFLPHFCDIVLDGIYYFVASYSLRGKWQLHFYSAPVFGKLIYIAPYKKFYEIRGQTIFELQTICEVL